MRPMFQRLAVVAAVVLAACSDRPTLAPSEPSPETPGPQRSFTPAEGCELKTAQEIKDDLHLLMINTPTSAWPSENSTFGKIDYIQAQRDYVGPDEAAALDNAIVKTKELIAFITSKYNQAANKGDPQNLALLNSIIADLYCFVGVSGIFDLNPGDPAKSFEIAGVGGVWFPANVVPVGTTVVVTALDPDVPALNTILDQYGNYLSVHLIPEHTFSEPNLPVVVICPIMPGGEPVSPDLLAQLQVGHQTATGFELLEPSGYPGPNPCPDVSAARNSSRGWLNGWLARAVDFVLPSQAHANPMMLVIGLGGRTGGFSSFGATNYTTTTIGLGGRSGGFAPPAASSRASSGPAYIPPATEAWDGVAGTSRSTDLPSVTVTTPGGDNIPPGTDGKNPIVNATVTFTIGATADPDDKNSEAKFCTGLAQATVLTDGDGVAAVPCINFGQKAGFANLAAEVDVSTADDLDFPGADDVVVDPATLNFLLETTPAAASKIVTYMGNPAVANLSYSYGTAFAEGAVVSPPPQVLVTDEFDNPVANVGIDWPPQPDANGAVLDLTTGTTTNSLGIATTQSWTLGAGAHTLTATIAGLASSPTATFTASTPTGVASFSCTTGTSKQDLVPWSVPRPGSSVRDITIWMSVTGQSNLSNQPYPAVLEVYETPAAFQAGGAGSRTVNGSVQLPGNNGNPTAVTFRLGTALPRITGNNTLYFRLSITADPTRKFQLWRTTSTSGDCGKALMYTNYPSLTPTLKGMRIQLTN